MGEVTTDTCERCGKEAPGSRKLMFTTSVLEHFQRAHVSRPFFCSRCQRIMRVYAIVGFSLLGIVLAAIIIVYVLAI